MMSLIQIQMKIFNFPSTFFNNLIQIKMRILIKIKMKIIIKIQMKIKLLSKYKIKDLKILITKKEELQIYKLKK